MTESGTIVVTPSLPRLLAMFVVSGLGMTGGILLIFGMGRISTIAAATVGGLLATGFLLAVATRRPQVVITSEGFTFRKLIGEVSHPWNDIRGPFVIIKIGMNRIVGYRLTEEAKARIGGKSASTLAGCDGGISGAFRITPEDLADILNAHAISHAQRNDA